MGVMVTVLGVVVTVLLTDGNLMSYSYHEGGVIVTMKNEIVKYHNYLNALDFKDFTAADYDFFMYLCATMKDKGTEEMTFAAAELREYVGYGHKGTVAEFSALLDGMNEKLLSMKAHLETDTELVRFVLFPTFRINKQTGLLTVRVNKDFQFLLNELAKNFTQFELQEFTELNSKYSKVLYRLLKQYRSTGVYHVKVDELRRLLGCPESYENKYFMTKVIGPAVKELQKDFPTLTCEPVRARTKGRPVTAYHFTFEVDGQIPGQMTLDQCTEELKRQRAAKIGQATTKKTGKKKNSFTDFEQREYDYKALESALVSRNG